MSWGSHPHRNLLKPGSQRKWAPGFWCVAPNWYFRSVLNAGLAVGLTWRQRCVCSDLLAIRCVLCHSRVVNSSFSLHTISSPPHYPEHKNVTVSLPPPPSPLFYGLYTGVRGRRRWAVDHAASYTSHITSFMFWDKLKPEPAPLFVLGKKALLCLMSRMSFALLCLWKTMLKNWTENWVNIGIF